MNAFLDAMSKRFTFLAGLIAGLACLATIPSSQAQQQFQGLCARVKIEILQELTLERIGFEATLEITNNDGEDTITDFFADLTFENPAASTNGVNDASSLFFVRAPKLENIESISGSGVIGPTKKAVIRWFIIPKIAAGGTSPNGVPYRVGCKLAGRMRGTEIPKEVLQVIPDTIFVKPEPQLEITYFQPRDVQGDDPFTENVESPIPFTLGVLVKNSGYGYARKLKIDSQQPKIVENKTDLLLIAQLIGTRVNDSALESANLVVNLGDIPPGQTRKGAWDMITSLSGEFVEFKASYTHASDLGGEETSVIKLLEAHFIAHEVLNDQAGRDALKDFLADTDRDASQIPDALYESEGNILPVNHLLEAVLQPQSGSIYKVQLTADKAGWGYMRVNDPTQGKLRIVSIVRSDGKVLNPNNYWTNIRYERIGNVRNDYLNILDLVALGPQDYTVTFAPPAADNVAPVTKLHFSGSATLINGKHYITPETQMYFISEDVNPVSIFYSLTNSPFLPAIPFRLRGQGEYRVDYYATDTSGNRETNQTAILVLSDAPPAFAQVNLTADPITVSGGALSVRPDSADLTFQTEASPTPINASVDIFQGVIGWPTLAGMPSSPTRETGATLTVAGDHVDYYRYQLDSGAWSGELPVASPILLTNLSAGDHRVAVIGRSRYGDYLEGTNVTLLVNINSAMAADLQRLPGVDATLAEAILDLRAGPDNLHGTSDDVPFVQVDQLIDVPGMTAQILNGLRSRAVVQDPKALAQVGWTVSSTAPVTRIQGTPATPSRARAVDLSVAGDGVTHYRWTINDGFYRAETPVLSLINLSSLTGTQQVVSVYGKIGGVYQPTNTPTVVRWKYHPLYGSDLSSLAKVRSVTFTNVAGAPVQFSWDGRNDTGVIMLPGWYTLRLTLVDDLGRSSFVTRLVQVGDLTAQLQTVAGHLRGPRNPHGRGRWSVWQDQSEGNWAIYAQDMSNPTNRPVRVSLESASQENPQSDGVYVAWQGRQGNGSWDVYVHDPLSRGLPIQVTRSADLDETQPAIHWPWLVYQFRQAGNTNAPWQLRAHNLLSGESTAVWPGAQDQLDPAVHAGQVVWQDHRDVGFGEIYYKNLETGLQRRLTTNSFGQYHPAVYAHWVVWQDNRHGQVDLYGFDLLRNREIRVTDSNENESRPYLDGPWAVCEEDSLGVSSANLRLIHLPTLRSAPLTRSLTLKSRPALAGGNVLWQDSQNGQVQIQAAMLPVVQAVFENQNAVAVTESLAALHQDAFSLLRLWNQAAGVKELTAYTAFVPTVQKVTASISTNGQTSGTNFQLQPGSFLWVKFDSNKVLDLGTPTSPSVNLRAGVNVLSFTRFPSGYSAFELIQALGLDKAKAVRMLDAESGRWLAAEVVENKMLGHDFTIPTVAVVLIDLTQGISNWQPN